MSRHNKSIGHIASELRSIAKTLYHMAELEKVVIEYGAKRRKDNDKWVPVYKGNVQGGQWYDTYEKALEWAKDLAEEEASRYSGDWDIQVIEKKY